MTSSGRNIKAGIWRGSDEGEYQSFEVPQRDNQLLEECIAELDALGEELSATGLVDSTRGFNLTWHDWLNLESQILVSKTIVLGALAREDSRGAHYRSDFPETGELETTRFTTIEMDDAGALKTGSQQVKFTIVKPGESLIEGEAGAPPTSFEEANERMSALSPLPR